MGAADPAIDMFERDGSVVVKAELPAIGRTLSALGTRLRPYLPLPEGCDTDLVSATMRHGVLEIVVPKTRQAVAKKIAVKSVG